MEQAQIQTIEGIKRSLKQLIVDLEPLNDYEWGALFRLGQALRDIRGIDPGKLGQLPLPEKKPEPGATQMSLPDSVAVQSGEDSLNEPANREDGREKAIGALKTVGEIIRSQREFTKPELVATIDRMVAELPPKTDEQPEFSDTGAPVTVEVPSQTNEEQFYGINPPEKVTCPGCKGEFLEIYLVLRDGVKECPKCGTALLGTAAKPKRSYHRKSKAIVA